MALVPGELDEQTTIGGAERVGEGMDSQLEEDEGPEPGDVIGNYVIRSRIGKGGMGWVYDAEHTIIGRRVALKMLRPKHVTDDESVERFFAEARAVNRIKHPGIIEVTDFGHGEHTYFIMEYLDGVTLRDYVDSRGPMTPDEVVLVIGQVCEALAAAHEVGILHRDIKPDNLFLVGAPGEISAVKVLDFGVAKLSGHHAPPKPVPMDAVAKWQRRGDSLETEAGVVLGTPEYMSPEQCRGLKLDERSDIYSLGLCAYFCLTGERAFAGSVGELFFMHVVATPEPISERASSVPAELEATVMQCLAKDPQDRPQSMSELQALLLESLWGDSNKNAVWTPAAETTAGVESFQSGEVTPALPRAAVSEVATTPAVAPRGSRRASSLLVGALALAAAFAGVWAMTADEVEAPARSMSAPLPTTVDVTFTSVPPAAEVRSVSTGELLGRTPMTLKTRRGEEASYRFALPGHEDVERAVSAQSDLELVVVLPPLPSPTEPAAASAVAEGPGKKAGAKRRPRDEAPAGAEAAPPPSAPESGRGPKSPTSIIDPFGD